MIQFSSHGLAFRALGEANRPPVVFLHGFLGSGRDWLPVARPLKDRFFCLLPDLPGHGRTRFSSPHLFSFSGFAQHLVNWLQEQRIVRPHLVGYSMGGRLALYLAVNYGQHFQSVVAESASPGLATFQARRERVRADEQWVQLLLQKGMQPFLERWYRQPIFRTLVQHPDFVDLLAERQKNEPRQLARALRLMGLGRQPYLLPSLTRLKLPLLLVTGEKDRKFQAFAERICQRNAMVQWVSVPGSGHNVHREAPQVFAGLLQAFFSPGDGLTRQ